MPLRLDIAGSAGPPRQLPLQAARTRVPVGPGERFRLVGDAGDIPPTVRVRRVGDSLVIDGLEGERELELNNYFGACRPGRECSFAFDAPGAPAGEITQDATPVAALADGSFLLFGTATNALPTLGEPTAAAAAGARAGSGSLSPGQIAAAGAGLLALAAVAGGGGGGGDSGPTAVSPTPTPTPDPPTTPPTTPPPTTPVPGDTVVPTLTITDNVATATTRGPVTFTFTFSEPVTGFTAADVAVTGGTAGTFTAAADGRTYTLVVTPNAGVQTGQVAVSVAAGVATDAAGNPNAAAGPASQAYDTRGPALAITDNVGAASTNAPLTFVFTFDEPVTGFTASDVSVTGGTTGAFSAAADGRTYTMVVTPAANTQAGQIAVSVAAGAAVDALGNPSTAAGPATQAYDTRSPALAITDNIAAAATNGPMTFTFRFDEPVTGFGTDDIAVTGGTRGAFTAIDAQTYTLVVAPPPAAAGGTIGVAVIGGAANDATGNPSLAASASQPFDTLAPTQRVSSFTALDNQSPGTGFLANGATTNDRTPTLALQLDALLGAGEELVLLRDGARIASTTTGSSLTRTEAPALAAGTYTYSALVADAAGNATVLDLNGAAAGTEFQIRIT